MQKIDEHIQWYEKNSTSYYDDIVRIELKKINDLYDVFNDCTDEMFVFEMIESFLKIIEQQRARIRDLEDEAAMCGSGTKTGCTLMSNPNASSVWNGVLQEGFQNDKQLQDAFTAYCLSNGKSSYTVNDYCSRIKNLWKTFCAEYNDGKLPEELRASEEIIQQDTPLLNAYNHMDELNCYIGVKIAESKSNRNWANVRAAFNKFVEFILSVER